VKPIFTAHLFPLVDAQLIELLRSLEPSEWDLPTIAPSWRVRDVAAHLLDTPLRRLSMGRDGYFTTPRRSIRSHDELVAFINELNRQGVEMYGRLSPSVLISMMAVACTELAHYLQSLDPMSDAKIGVSWAGETKSANWFDIAREYTERWHHQQQIRLATNRPGIMTRELYHPVLDCFLRALPYTYRNRDAAAGTHVRVNVSGECGGSWFLYRGGQNEWRLVEEPEGPQTAEATVPQEIAWRLFTKGISRDAAASHITVSGDIELAAHVVQMIAIVG
jgi:uncharacterized protein (TIGR03083 family)